MQCIEADGRNTTITIMGKITSLTNTNALKIQIQRSGSTTTYPRVIAYHLKAFQGYQASDLAPVGGIAGFSADDNIVYFTGNVTATLNDCITITTDSG